MTNSDNLIAAAEVRRLLGGISAMTLHRRLRADPTFPSPIRFTAGGRRFWVRAEILEWIDAKREPAPPAPAEAGDERA